MNILIIVAIVVIVFVVFSFNKYQKDPFVANTYDEVLSSEFGLITALAAKVAKADQKVESLELELIRQTLDELSLNFSNKTKAREILQEIFDKERSQHDNLDLITSRLKPLLDKHKTLKILEFLTNLAFVDKHFSPQEEQTIRSIAAFLDFANIEQILNNFKTYYKDYKKTTKDPYKVLGVSENVSQDELKQTYRTFVKRYHPDVLKGRGLGDDYIQKATARLQEVNEAYEDIKKQKGY